VAKRNASLNGFKRGSPNRDAFSMATRKPGFTLSRGRRYRMKPRTANDDIHPLHPHRHSFERRISAAGRCRYGQGVAMPGGFQEMASDVAANPGPLLFHCHRRLRMDFGFMALFDYASSYR
jgi:FtsP/CotA-like multicopper oxidase with cupredoxin domain